MNKNIGFYGGGVVASLGTVADFQLFFHCIHFVSRKYLNLNWDLLTDRLYKRYLKYHQIDEACKLMNIIEKEFLNLPVSCIDFESDSTISVTLDKKKINLFELFELFFSYFFLCAEAAQENFHAFKDIENYQYEPVRIVITDQPWYMYDKLRNLQDYDDLKGLPFWHTDNN